MKVLVTGGAGYVGSHAVRALESAGHDPVVLDDLSKGHRKAVRADRLVVASLLDRAAVGEALDRHDIEAVFHFAAHSYVGESVAHPRKYFHDNLIGAIHLIEEMIDRGIRAFVFSSTCAIYGNPVRVPMDEDHPQDPITPYGDTKLAIERMLRGFDTAYRLRYAALRYFNAAGADAGGEIGELHVPETHLIPLVLDAAHDKNGEIAVHGGDYPTRDGTCIRDYIHVTDLADAHVRALEWLVREDRSGIFNLGTGQGRSVLEVLESARLVTGREIRARIGPRRPGDPPELVALAGRAREVLGWKPRHSSLETILQTAWVWRQNRDRVFGTGA